MNDVDEVLHGCKHVSYFLKSVQDYAKNVTLSNLPDYFQKKGDSGDARSGEMQFKTTNLDDAYGEIAALEISWSEVNPLRYHVGKESTVLMEQYSGTGVGFSKREIIKIHGHDAYFVVGAKKEVKRGKIYMSTLVLVNFCCPATKRGFVARFTVHKDNFSTMEEHVRGIASGIICH